MMHVVAVVFAWLALVAAWSVESAQEVPIERELIADGGFDCDLGRWKINNWAGNQVDSMLDSDHPGAGLKSLRLDLKRVDHQSSFEVVRLLPEARPGDALLVRLMARKTANTGPAHVIVRRQEPPWTVFGSAQVSATGTWESLSVPAMIPAGSDVAALSLIVESRDVSSLWIDDVRVGVIPSVDRRRPLLGNLVRNGSFEVGHEGWVARFRQHGAVSKAPAAMDSISPEDWSVDMAGGTGVLRFEVRRDVIAIIDSAPFVCRHGQPVRVRMRVKPPVKGASLRVSLGANHSPVALDAVFSGEEWTELDRILVPSPSGRVEQFLELTTTSSGTWMIDDVHVSQAEGAGASTMEVGSSFVEAPPGRIYRENETPQLLVRVAAAIPESTLPVRVVIKDHRDEIVFSINGSLPVDAGGRGSMRLVLPSGRYGAYHASVTVAGHAGSEALYAVVPHLPSPDGSGRSFFGGHFHLDSYSLTLAERGGFRWLRLNAVALDTLWQAMEPREGDRSIYHMGVRRALERGFSVLGSLNAVPAWAAVATGIQPDRWWHSRMPRSWEDWRSYVQLAARAFPGIRAWEVGNEPDAEYLIVPPGVDKAEVYARMVKESRSALSEVDPSLRMVALAVSAPEVPLLSRALDMGVAAHADALSFHYYNEDVDVMDRRPGFEGFFSMLRRFSGRQGIPPEIWHTEGGMWLRRAPSRLVRLRIPPQATDDRVNAAIMVRNAVALKAMGVERHFHFAGHTSATGTGNQLWMSDCNGLFDFDGSARPGLAAHAAMVLLLDAAVPGGVSVGRVGVEPLRIARFSGPRGSRIAVVWANKPIPVSSVPELIADVNECRDIMGNVIGIPDVVSDEPCYFISLP